MYPVSVSHNTTQDGCCKPHLGLGDAHSGLASICNVTHTHTHTYGNALVIYPALCPIQITVCWEGEKGNLPVSSGNDVALCHKELPQDRICGKSSPVSYLLFPFYAEGPSRSCHSICPVLPILHKLTGKAVL